MTLAEYQKLTREEQVRLGAETMAVSAAVHGRTVVRHVGSLKKPGLLAKTRMSVASTTKHAKTSFAGGGAYLKQSKNGAEAKIGRFVKKPTSKKVG